MKLEIVSVSASVSQAKMPSGEILWFTPTKTPYYTYGIKSKKVGDVFEIPDDAVKVSQFGRPYVDGMTSETAIRAINLETAFMKRDLMIAQMESQAV